jgi:hypothetical protein
VREARQAGRKPKVSPGADVTQAGKGVRDEILEQLIAEQAADDEGSPLEESERQVKVHKRV